MQDIQQPLWLVRSYGILQWRFFRFVLWDLYHQCVPDDVAQPWYGRAIARCLASEYLLRHFPYDDLLIYEMGGGNGTLSLNILDYLHDEHPEVYERTSYKIIEISSSLAKIQQARLKRHPDAVEVINKSIFEWSEIVNSPCFFLALEVIVSTRLNHTLAIIYP